MFKQILLSSKAAIDLASIMVGVIVIGLIGGVIAATVFAIIPWAQDSAAKQQLESIVAAQSAAIGLTSDPHYSLPEGINRNSFTDSSGLNKLALLIESPTYCTVTFDEGKGYFGYAKSSSGKIWMLSNSDNKAKSLNESDVLVGDCNHLREDNENLPGQEEGDENSEPSEPGTSPTVPNDPNRVVYGSTQFTLKCSSSAYGALVLPFTNATGKVTLSRTDGTVLHTANIVNKDYHSFKQDLYGMYEYVFAFDGTFDGFHSKKANGALVNTDAHSRCFSKMDAWNTHAGTTDASYAMAGMSITSVPESIPSTVKDISYIFSGASNPGRNVSNWFTANVTGFTGAFQHNSFNSSLAAWDMSKTKDLSYMFDGARTFNQPLNDWDVSNVENISYMFNGAHAFNQPLDKWDVSNVTNMSHLFAGEAVAQGSATLAYASSFNRPIGNWDTSNVTDMSDMFSGSKRFNQPLNDWDVSNVTNMSNMFGGYLITSSYDLSDSYSTYSIYNQPLDKWDVSNVTNMSKMFWGNKAFNQNISSWDVHNVTNMSYMFKAALHYGSAFNQNINNWDVSNVTNMSHMFSGTTYNNKNAYSNYNQPLDKWDTSNVTNMEQMFRTSTFNQDISKWNTGKVMNMSSMFNKNTVYSYNLNSWQVDQMTASNQYATFASFPKTQWPLF